MTAPEDPQAPQTGSETGSSAPEERSALSFLLAAIPFGLLVTYRYGIVGMLARLAPVLVVTSFVLLLPMPVRRRPWAVWTFLHGGIGGVLVVHIVLELR